MLVDVTVACASSAEANSIARALLEQRLAACAQTWPIRSTYRWHGQIEQADEVQLVIKTRAPLADAVCATIVALHSYDVPAITVTHGVVGTAATEQWLRDTTDEAAPQGMQPQHKPE